MLDKNAAKNKASHQKKFNLDKYRGIIFSVALFLFLDASVLIFNFYVSFEIAEDAEGVNLAGRQRMLSQRIAKTLFVLDAEDQNSVLFKAAFDELQLSAALFNDTLNAFISGGVVRGASTEMVALDAVTHQAGKASLLQTQNLWTDYKKAIDVFASNVKANQPFLEDLGQAVALARKHNLTILGSMNDLTVTLENIAASKAARLRMIQTLGICLAIINFLIIMFHFLRQLRNSDRVLELARRETTEILETVNEGLFLIDKNLMLGQQYSARLADILGPQEFSGKPLQALLENIVSQKDAKTASGFIDLLFDQKIKAKLIGDLNPLSLVEVNIAQDKGGFLTKHLQFNFARAYQPTLDGKQEISHVLVTVLDISAQVKLERELQQSRKHGESQLEMITGLLHTHPSLLKAFIANSFRCFNRINTILQKTAKTEVSLRDKITLIFREVHNFKGEASALKLTFFEDAAHAMEDTLTALRNKPDLNGNDYLGLTVQLENLMSYTQQVEHLTVKLGQFSIVANKNTLVAPASAGPDQWAFIQEFAEAIAERNGKKINVVASGFNEIVMEPAHQQALKELLVQLLRNAIVHGIESPEHRTLSQKPDVGRIDLRLAKVADNEMELSVMDDGLGLDYNAIRTKALRLGKWPQNEVESWSHQQLLHLIFQSGFSTADNVDKDAGRGVGMEAVKSYVLSQQGKINVSSRTGRYCRFVITLPLVAPQGAEDLAA